MSPKTKLNKNPLFRDHGSQITILKRLTPEFIQWSSINTALQRSNISIRLCARVSSFLAVDRNHETALQST